MAYEILIKLPSREPTNGNLVKGTYRIGSSPASHIQIKLPGVSPRHAVLTVRSRGVQLQDAGSEAGTYLDGARVGNSPVSVPSGASIRVGEAEIVIRKKEQESVAAPRKKQEVPNRNPAGEPPSPSSPPQATREPRGNQSPRAAGILAVSGIPYEYRKVVQGIKLRVHEELLNRMNLKNLTLSGANYEQVRKQASETIGLILQEIADKIPQKVDIRVLEQELINEAVGLGPLEPLLDKPEITEIMVNGPNAIYIEKEGVLYRTDLMFADDTQVLTAIERIVAPIGRRIDESQPLVDARLKDGSRVNAIIPPLALDGPSLTIRKFSKKPMTIDRLIANGALSPDIGEFLRLAVLLRKSILISGGTGSGKTTLLNVVSSFIPDNERILTIEDAAELRLSQAHVVRLEARPPNIEGKGEVNIRDLVRNALRMRPDRIVVGECRGGEALDMLQAMNTGHEGSLTTIHANSTRDALARLETLVLMAGFELPLRAIREQVASAIHLVVQLSRYSDGTRKIQAISEVTGMEGDIITTQELFEFRREGTTDEGKVLGRHVSCGVVPTFLEEIRVRRLPFDLRMFQENEMMGIDQNVGERK